MEIRIQDDQLDLDRFFPFYMVIDQDLTIEKVGKSLSKILPTPEGKTFREVFTFKRPWSVKYEYASILEYSKQLFILQAQGIDLKFRWQVEPLYHSQKILFIGTPWIVSAEEMLQYGLVLNDFALHDTLPDIFQLLKTHDINNQDIKLLADEIETKKNLLQKVIDHIPHQVFLKDQNSRYVLVNKKVEEMLGVPKNLIIGKRHEDFFENELGEYSPTESDLRVLEGEARIYPEVERHLPDGITKIFHIEKIPFELETNKPGILGIASDITQMKQSEAKLKESEDRYRMLIENALDVIYRISFDGFFVYLNPLAETVSEFSMEELLQKRYVDLIREDYKEAIGSYYLSEEFIKDGLNSYKEFPIITKSGKEVWIGQKVLPIYQDGHIVGYQGVARDVTEVKRLEIQRQEAEDEWKESASRLRLLIENLNAGVLVEDENRRIVAVNDVFCEIFNIPVTASDLVGADCSNAAEQSKHLFQKPEEFVHGIDEILAHKQLVSDEVLEFKDGRIWERDYIPIFVQDVYRGHLWTYKDITARKIQEMELLSAKKAAEASSVAKEQFLSTMSHEIRTPMNAVIGMTQLLMNKEPKQDQIQYLNAIKYSADNLLGLINNILDFSKIESGKVSLEKIEFDIFELAHKIQNIFKFQAEEKGLALYMYLDSGVERYLNGDTVRLNQILTNLLGNALKFTEKGEVSILIRQTAQIEDVIWLRFEVKDTGIGIAPEKLGKIFERFTQADSDTTRKYGGTGLGLTITKLLIEILGGYIDVKSTVGLGTTFVFELPFQRGKKEKIQQEKLKTKEMETNLGGKTVLLVEDNLLNQMIASEFMKNWGLEVVTAENGVEALEKMASEPHIDLVLMDLQMPEMDGYTATKRIRERFADTYPHLPIIALSASTSAEVREKVEAVGMNDYLSKPFEAQVLYSKISHHLNQNLSVAKPLKANPSVKETTEGSLFNLSYYEDFSGGNKAFVREMIHVYLEETPSILLKLNESVQQNNLPLISASCHKLKTSFMMMGIDASDAKQLEEWTKSGNKDYFLIKSTNDKIQRLGHASIAALKAHLLTY